MPTHLRTMSNQNTFQPDELSAIYLDKVSVQYRIPTEQIRNFKEYIIRYVQGKIKHETIFALKEISLHINKGEIYGILGRNGAGKSTLLKVISKVIIPKDGRVWVRGKVSPLLQLGAGFHVELTGRENIFLNATLLGHTRKEVDEKLDEIIEFSDIGKFLEAPLRTYSSGMQSRLGFAVATAWDPEILLLDEVLSVGDEKFQEKSLKRMESFRVNGSTVLLVSHDINLIRSICKSAIWLEKGQIVMSGAADEVCDAYQNAVF